MTSKKKRTENRRIQLEKESEAREVRGSSLSFAKETRKGESLLKLDSLKSRTLGSSNWFVKLASWTLYGLGLLLVVVAVAGILYRFKVVFFPKRKESWRKLVADLSLAKEKMIGFLTFMVRNFGKRGNYEGDMFDWR